MISIKELNENTYKETEFFLDKNNFLWVDLNVVLNERKTSPVKLGNIDEISSPDYKTRPIFKSEQLDSIFYFFKNSMQNNILQIENNIKEHIKQYPNAQSFKNKLPPEVRAGKKENKEDLVIDSENKVVLQNMNNLNRYLFNFITNIATGEIDRKEKISPDVLLKILNKKHILKINQKREKQSYLSMQTERLAKNFNKYLDDLVNDEKFLNFIKDNKNPLSVIINTPNKNRSKLIELADKRLSGREELRKARADAYKMYKDYASFIAKDVLSLAINSVNRLEKGTQISNILTSLIANKKQKQ